MQYRDDNFGGMQYRDNNFNQIPILSTKRTTLQMAADSKFADIRINIGINIILALTKLWTPQFQTLVV